MNKPLPNAKVRQAFYEMDELRREFFEHLAFGFNGKQEGHKATNERHNSKHTKHILNAITTNHEADHNWPNCRAGT